MAEKMGPREAGRKGGQTTAQRHGASFYAEIGQKGGKQTSRDRKHMAKIGEKGGRSSRRRRGESS